VVSVVRRKRLVLPPDSHLLPANCKKIVAVFDSPSDFELAPYLDRVERGTELVVEVKLCTEPSLKQMMQLADVLTSRVNALRVETLLEAHWEGREMLIDFIAQKRFLNRLRWIQLKKGWRLSKKMRADELVDVDGVRRVLEVYL